MAGGALLDSRHRAGAQIDRQRAAGAEHAAGRRFERRRRVADEDDAALLALEPGVGQRHRRDQRLGVGMARRRIEPITIGDLHHPAEIEHENAVADVPHDREVVADEQQGQAELALQPHQQVDDLRPDRDIERRYRLVADDQPGPQDHRARDADALALTAGELVRIAVDHMRRQAGSGQHVPDARPDLGSVEVRLVRDQRLGDDVAYGHARTERGKRVLEHDLHAAPLLAQPFRVESREVLAEPDDAARARLDQTEHGAAECRLAAAGFADDAERLAGMQLEAYAIDRLERHKAPPQQAADRDREMHREVLDAEQRRAHASRSRWQALARGASNSSSRGHSAQRSNAKAQRLRNAQPSGNAWRFGGCPGIVLRSAAVGSSSRGIELSRPRVRMLRVVEDRLHRPYLDDPAGVHHHHPIAQPGDHAEIVSDQHDRHAGFAAQPLQQLQDLRLHGGVERRGRLVGDQQVGLAQQRDRDHHALAHAARELVRVALEAAARRGQPDLIEQPEAGAPRVRLTHPFVLDQHLGHLARNPQVWIERGHRVLKDHREPDTADFVQLAPRQAQQLPAAKAGAARAAAVAGEQAHDREEGLGLARAELADHAHALALIDPKAQIAHGCHLAFRRRESGSQILDFQERGRPVRGRGGRSAVRGLQLAINSVSAHPDLRVTLDLPCPIRSAQASRQVNAGEGALSRCCASS